MGTAKTLLVSQIKYIPVRVDAVMLRRLVMLLAGSLLVTAVQSVNNMPWDYASDPYTLVVRAPFPSSTELLPSIVIGVPFLSVALIWFMLLLAVGHSPL